MAGLAGKLKAMEDLGESWVELSNGDRSSALGRITPPGLPPAQGLCALMAEHPAEYLRLLREAQRESRDSSAKQSHASSRRDSPKSPPNSPNTEPSTEDDLKGIYINCWNTAKDPEVASTEWVWEWSSRPDQLPPKDWRFKHPLRPVLSSVGEVCVPLQACDSSTELLPPVEDSKRTTQRIVRGRKSLSMRRTYLFSRGALAAVLVTNLVSLLIGAGLGVWLSRKGLIPPRIIIQ